MYKFEVGKTYSTRSPCDHDCIIEAQIISRTDKTIKTLVRGAEKTFRVRVYFGVEWFKPWGSYSMCPTMSADRPIAQ